MPTYDLLVYHDFTDNLNDFLNVGDDAGQKLGHSFEGLTVAALGDPIHPSKNKTVVLSHGRAPMPEVQALLERPPESSP